MDHPIDQAKIFPLRKEKVKAEAQGHFQYTKTIQMDKKKNLAYKSTPLLINFNKYAYTWH